MALLTVHLFFALFACSPAPKQGAPAPVAPPPAKVEAPVVEARDLAWPLGAWQGVYTAEETGDKGSGQVWSYKITVVDMPGAGPEPVLVEVDGFQTQSVYAATARAEGPALHVLLARDDSPMKDPKLAPGAELLVLKAEGEAYKVEWQGLTPSLPGTGPLAAVRAPLVYGRGPKEDATRVVDVVSGRSMGPVSLGMSREAVDKLGLSVRPDPNRPDLEDCRLVGPYVVMFKNGVVSSIGLTLSSQRVSARVGATVLTPDSDIDTVRSAFPSCSPVEAGEGGASSTCDNGGTVIYNSPSCARPTFGGVCADFSGPTVVEIRVVARP